MMSSMRKNKGSVSIYLTIITTSVVLVFSILLSTVSNSKNTFIVKSSLVRQQDLILSDFSKSLYSDYGIMATDIPDIKEEDFNKMCSIAGAVNNFEVEGLNELTSQSLHDEIIRFSKPRFPVSAAAGIFSRVKSMVNEVELIEEIDVIPSNEKVAQGDELQFDELLQYIVLICEKWPKKENEDKDSFHISEIGKVLKDYNKADKYTNEFVKDITTDLNFTDETLMKLSDGLMSFYSIETNFIYQFVLFNHYITKMFSCKVNTLVINGKESERKNMRGKSINSITHASEYEIEKIIFGNEDEENNLAFAQASIAGIRLVTQLLCFLLDTKQREKIKTIATAICTAAAVLSAGSVIIDPQAVEAVILIVMATVETYKDCKKLLNGESVELIPAEGFEKIELYYTDYLAVLLLAVPKESKLKRIENIISKNIPAYNGCFFMGVKVGCKYKGVNYQVEGFYH